jgi:protein required for attachment to host cells
MDKPGQYLELVKAFENPAIRLKGSELRGDEPGKTRPRRKNALRGAATAYPTAPKDVETERFAKGLADYLRVANSQNRFQSLVLVAAPKFLGLLKSDLAGPVHNILRITVDKDYTEKREEDLMVLLSEKIEC